MEDALMRLDRLTQEEARMTIAENLRATHAVDERVREVSERVHSVDDRVASVNDKVAEVIRGKQLTFRRARCVFDPELLRRNGNKGSHDTSRTFVISKRHRYWLWILMHHFREPIAGERPQMALPAGSVN